MVFHTEFIQGYRRALMDVRNWFEDDEKHGKGTSFIKRNFLNNKEGIIAILKKIRSMDYEFMRYGGDTEMSFTKDELPKGIWEKIQNKYQKNVKEPVTELQKEAFMELVLPQIDQIIKTANETGIDVKILLKDEWDLAIVQKMDEKRRNKE